MPKRNARPDTADYRDFLYTPPLLNVPKERPLSFFRRFQVPVLDQGQEGSCTGFGLATVANWLLRTQAGGDGSFEPRSPRMAYEMAQRYDEWPGEDYEGSSCRAAVKGWSKHGLCSEKEWPYEDGGAPGILTRKRDDLARHCPLGAYYRVNPKRITDMHVAITEVGALYVSANTHTGWDSSGTLSWNNGETLDGGAHAFCLVGYDSKGFWFQNSWGAHWGREGFGHISYNDWLSNGRDVWALRLGVPVSG